MNKGTDIKQSRQALLEANELAIGYRSGNKLKKVQEHLQLALYPGELTCLLGANGTGKSTLLRTLSASQPALEGTLRIQGKSILEYTDKELSRMIGVVLTDKTFAGGLTVYEVVALGRQPHTGFFGRLHAHDKEIIEKALNDVGITHKAHCYTAELSDGERQKAMIAKALVQECPLIILDEPTAFLDVVSRIEIMTLLHQLATEQHKAILLSTHDIEQALVLGDKLWLLSNEGGLECGVTEDLILNHRMDTLFHHKNIRFDYDHGVYYPLAKGERKIIVESKDEILRHWVLNALNRNGFVCMAKEESYSQDFPTLEAITPKQFSLKNGDELIQLSSLGELIYTALPKLLSIQTSK